MHIIYPVFFGFVVNSSILFSAKFDCNRELLELNVCLSVITKRKSAIVSVGSMQDLRLAQCSHTLDDTVYLGVNWKECGVLKETLKFISYTNYT